ncbi:hypothetical protein [Agrobacterium vaccinii]|uniref:hypothetical protein n=1 Tax=Agrobacterium vaccinii TaxID=2735528 RepID=UPI001E41B1DE|nr:hypothetical protein [Agrobacterium vaccinii]UHS56018.1 hypothetical protein HRS00_03920 [Agrobacterium vaccinii]
MSNFEKIEINGKTVWLPKQQEPQPLPRQAVKPKGCQPKRVGKQYGERKNWW